STAAGPSSGAPAQAAPPPFAAPPAGPDRKAVLANALKALDAYRPAILEKCFRPALATGAGPPRVKLRFNITFDAAGKQIARGLMQDRDAPRPELGDCAAGALPVNLEVPPPGAIVAVDGEWELP